MQSLHKDLQAFIFKKSKDKVNINLDLETCIKTASVIRSEYKEHNKTLDQMSLILACLLEKQYLDDAINYAKTVAQSQSQLTTLSVQGGKKSNRQVPQKENDPYRAQTTSNFYKH